MLQASSRSQGSLVLAACNTLANKLGAAARVVYKKALLRPTFYCQELGLHRRSTGELRNRFYFGRASTTAQTHTCAAAPHYS